jgi:hypothetical protein
MNTLYSQLKKMVKEKSYYINGSTFNKEDFTLHCFRHSVSESKIDLFELSLQVIKHYDFELGDNEYFMFDFLITRQLKSCYIKQETLSILNLFFSDTIFKPFDNMYISFNNVLGKEILELINSEDVKSLELILNITSLRNIILNTKNEINKKIYNEIFKFPELLPFKAKDTINHF